ncbi:MAG TPA: carbohydrate ABC transporter permease [Candidatus Limnocylindria bacterium]|nr:carbohydrate ABC transporter permease [Candidatus Limnocylindria bacterium]
MRGRGAAVVVVRGLLALAALVVAAPLVWMLLVSLGLPGDPTLAHYRALFERLGVARALVNSAALALTVTAVSLVLNSLAGYAFAKLEFRGREPLFRALLAGLVIPGQVGMLPLFLGLKELGLVNTYLGVMVPSLASVFGIFLVRQYAQGIPQSLLDAARIDGASELTIYRTLVLRLCRPVLVTLALFTFLGSWNDFLWPLVVLSDEDRYTLPVALAALLGEHAQDTELMMAGAVLTVAPVLVLFLCLQRYYIESVAAGALKE